MRASVVAIPSAVCVLVALAGCPTVDLGDSPVVPGSCRPDPAYYEETIWPQMIAPGAAAQSCVSEAGCHQRSNGRSALRLITGEPLAASDHRANYDVVTRFLNCGSPEASSLLTKPLSGVDPHGGGDLFAPGSAQEMVFLQWFQQ